MHAKIVGSNIVRKNNNLVVDVTGGMTNVSISYELVSKNLADNSLTSITTVTFPASSAFSTQRVNIPCPTAGQFWLLARVGGVVLRPADLHVNEYIVVDMTPPTPAATLQRTLVQDIDCTMATPLREKDGATRVVTTAFGNYRESSGTGSNAGWALDGFSYGLTLPDATSLYQLEVVYPDDERRSMGFWTNDGVTASGDLGAVLTGGVETGDHYRLSKTMKTHTALFYPRGTNAVVAVLNLDPGLRAAASHIRIYKITSELTAAAVPSRTDSRLMGYYFEEYSRWLRQFGATSTNIDQQALSMERWATMCRYTGANLLFPTLNNYRNCGYTSLVLDGWDCTTLDKGRLCATIAEKYGLKYVPEVVMTPSVWFDSRIMGWATTDTHTLAADGGSAAWILRDKNGNSANGTAMPLFNALHPTVQAKYLQIIGELADNMSGCAAFAGVSSRIMANWQWEGYNALPGLNWGYDDWTISQYTLETGDTVPGTADDPTRFSKRFAYLTGTHLAQWQSWRCSKLLAFHRQLRDRIRQVNPNATLYLTAFSEMLTGATVNTTSFTAQLKEMGLDVNAYASEPGIAIIPWASYGRRYSTPVADSLTIDGMYNPETKAIATTGAGQFGVYSTYFEVNDNLDWNTLGTSAQALNFDANAPADRHELELYAVALADSDTCTLVNGGNGNIFGTQQYLGEFMAEYRGLPAVSFTDFTITPNSPVKVWYKQVGNDFFFYAVNKERFAETVTLSLANPGTVVSAATGAPVTLNGNQLVVTLQPYQLRSYKTTSTTTSLTSVAAATPSNETTIVAQQVAFANNLVTGLTNGNLAIEMTQAQAQSCLDLINAASAALTAGDLWTARTNLERPDMVRLYHIIGAWPPGLQDRTVSRGLIPASPSPMPEFAFTGITGDARGKLLKVEDLTFDTAGNFWVASDEQTMLFNAVGAYQRTVRLMLPATPDTGDGMLLNGGLTPPAIQYVYGLRALSDGKLVSLNYNGGLYQHDPTAGRIVTLSTGATNYGVNANNTWHLATDAADNLYVSSESPVGVWKFHRDGSAAFDFAGGTSNQLCSYAPSGTAVDSTGRIYVGDKNGARVVVYAADGTQQAVIPFTYGGPRRVAVSADGTWLFVATNGNNVVGFLNQVYQWNVNVGGAVTALAARPSSQLVLGFSASVGGSIIKSFTYNTTGLTAATLAVPALDTQYPAFLVERTGIKSYAGAVYYLSKGKLVRVTPGTTDTVAQAFDPALPGAPISFCFAPDGTLYLGSLQSATGVYGVFVFKCTKNGSTWNAPVSLTGTTPIYTDTTAIRPYDLAIAADGRLLMRWDSSTSANWPETYIFARDLTSGTMTQLYDAGYEQSNMAPWDFYHGLSVDARTGNTYFVNVPTRSISCLSSTGVLLWKTAYEKHEPAGILPIRGPQAVTTDSKGRVWVADTAADRILCFDANGKLSTSFGTSGTLDKVDGQSLSHPTGLTTVIDSNSQEWLYIADQYNQRLLKYRLVTAPLYHLTFNNDGAVGSDANGPYTLATGDVCPEILDRLDPSSGTKPCIVASSLFSAGTALQLARPVSGNAGYLARNTSGYDTIPDNGGLTFEASFLANSYTAGDLVGLISQFGTGGMGMTLRFQNGTTNNPHLVFGVGSGALEFTPTTSLVGTGWHRVVAVYVKNAGGGNSKLELFLDGLSVQSVTYPTDSNQLFVKGGIAFGVDAPTAATGRVLDGQIDDIYITEDAYMFHETPPLYRLTFNNDGAVGSDANNPYTYATGDISPEILDRLDPTSGAKPQIVTSSVSGAGTALQLAKPATGNAGYLARNTSGYVTIPDNGGLTCEVSFLANSYTAGDLVGLITQFGTAGVQPTLRFQNGTTNNPHLLFALGQTGATLEYTPTTSLVGTGWHHIAAVYAKDAGAGNSKLELFVDGASVQSVSYPTSSYQLFVKGGMAFGVDAPTVATRRVLDGQIDEIFITGGAYMFHNNLVNIPPTVSLSANTTLCIAPGSVTLTATASDSDDAIRKVEFYQGSTLLGTATSAPYQYNWTNIAAGSYVITAKAYDYFNHVTTSSSVNLTAWATADIGTVGVTGSASYASPTFTVSGAGAGVTGTADAFRFVYQQVSGNWTIIARVATAPSATTAERAGVMLRQNLNANSIEASSLLKPTSTYYVYFQRRTTAGGTTNSTNGSAAAAPYWVKLVRSGNTLSAYRSANGASWTQVGSNTTVTMTDPVYIGLAVSSGSTSAASTVTFDNVTVTTP
ncbi:MAG TPA: Ig-like domain-containing protein [Armatimonadota bacterium]